MPSQAYFNGDFYDAIATTAPGESPATHPAKWAKVEIPRDAARYAAQAAYAFLLSGEGQNDKRRSEHRHAQEVLDESLLAMRRHRSHHDTISVLTR